MRDVSPMRPSTCSKTAEHRNTPLIACTSIALMRNCFARACKPSELKTSHEPRMSWLLFKVRWWRWFLFGNPINWDLNKESRRILRERWEAREPKA